MFVTYACFSNELSITSGIPRIGRVTNFYFKSSIVGLPLSFSSDRVDLPSTI